LSRRVEPHGTLVVKSGTDFRGFSVIKLRLGAAGTRPHASVEQVQVTSAAPEDPDIKAMTESYTAQMAEEMKKVVAHSSVELDGRFESIRRSETNLGNLVCDCIRAAMSADCVVLNSGTLRSDVVHPAGPLSMHDLVSVLPMMDPVYLLSLRGADLLAALENGVSMYPALEGRFPQVSGIEFAFDPEKPPGERVMVESVMVADAPVALEREYKFATKEFLVNGKDGYVAFMVRRWVRRKREGSGGKREEGGRARPSIRF